MTAVSTAPVTMSISLLQKQNGEKMLAVVCSYHPKTIGKLRTLEGRRWNPVHNRWELPVLHLETLRQSFPEAVISQGVEDYLKNQELKRQHLLREFEELLNGIDLTKPLPNSKTLFQHQRIGVTRILKYRRQILADDMGLGKTIQSLVAAKILSQQYGWKIIIIAPVALLENWKREAAGLGISSMMISVHSWAKIPPVPKCDFMLFGDEAHYIQSGTRTKRGKAFLELAKSSFCRVCVPITGTPMKNGRPINLLPLLQSVKHSISEDIKYYHQRYCDAHPGRFTRWDISGAKNLPELSMKIKDAMIRRTKEQCLDLPEKLRVMKETEFSEEAEKLYNDTLRDLRRKFEDRVAKGEVMGDAEALVLFGQLAHAAAIGKVETAQELACELIEQHQQVVIFSTYRKPLDMLYNYFQKEGISTELLTGDTKDRQGCVDRFLAKKSRVFLLSMAGGAGIDLYTAQTIILINRPWTPGDVEQIEARLHRIGQKNQVTSIWLQYGDVDIYVDEILEAKTKNIDLVVDGKRKIYKANSINNLALEVLSSR